MLLRDGRLVVVVEDGTRKIDGELYLAVYAVSGILSLMDSNREFTGDVLRDFEDAYNAGLVPITKSKWRKVNGWASRGDFITVEMTASGKYRWGFVKEHLLRKREYLTLSGEIATTGYLTDDELRWIQIWVEAMSFEQIRIKRMRKIDIDGKKTKRKKRVEKRKERKNGEHWRILAQQCVD